MSSLALQLFVNINKLINQHSGVGMGSHHAKELVDRVKGSHPELLACNDPSNAHTDALTAFAIGLGLRELRRCNDNQFTQHAFSGMLKDALDRADEQLERLDAAEVHLVLQAHEEYKTYMGVRADLMSSRIVTGRARGVDDILPMATTTPTWGATGNKSEDNHELVTELRLHASDIDVGPMQLPELEQALTGEVSFYTQRTGAGLTISRAQESEDVEISEFSASQPSFASQGGFIQADPGEVPDGGIIAHQVRADRVAERELSDGGELRGETVDQMLSRQRGMADMRRQEIPAYGGNWQEANRGGAEQLVRKRSALEQSEWSGPNQSSLSTHLHSESAADTTSVGNRKKRKPIPLIVWGAPTFLLLPPLGMFYAGVLWGREAYGSSLVTLGLSLAGSAGMLAWWLLLY